MDIKSIQEAKEEKAKLVGMYNALQDKIDAYGLDDIATDSGPFKQWCTTRQRIEMRIEEINKFLESNNK